MPNRILKESVCTSEDIDGLTPEQEVFFYRLLVVCDDFGLMDARPAILKSRCYPLKSIDSKRIQSLVNALSEAGLIVLYESDGKPYLCVTNWEKHQTIRAKKPKYPMPSANTCKQMQADESNGKQMQADVPVIQSNPIQSYSESNPIHPPEKPAVFEAKGALIALGVEPQVADDFLRLRKKKRAEVTETALAGISKEASKAGMSLNDALTTCCKNGWQGFEASWVAGRARASPAATRSEERREVIRVLTGGGSNANERDITGEAVRVA